MQLKDDLSETVGEPVDLFNGSDASWNRASPQYHCYVTDGTYLFRSKSGKLLMIWSALARAAIPPGSPFQLPENCAGHGRNRLSRYLRMMAATA